MTPGTLLKNLVLTFVFSLFLTGLLYSVWFSSRPRGFEEKQALTILLAIGDVCYNLLLTIAATPVFLLAKSANFDNVQRRLIIYFIGPVLLILFFVCLTIVNLEDMIAVLLAGLSFLVIHAFFYRRLLLQFKKPQ